MLFFPLQEKKKNTFTGKLKYNLNIGVWKKRLVVFMIINIVSFVFAPDMFYGFWDGVQSVSASMAESRKVSYIRRKHGRTIADLYEATEVWKGVPSAINPLNWGK